MTRPVYTIRGCARKGTHDRQTEGKRKCCGNNTKNRNRNNTNAQRTYIHTHLQRDTLTNKETDANIPQSGKYIYTV